MKRFFGILSILVILPVLTACNLPSWSTYTNSTYGFQLQYPSGGSIAPGATDTNIRINLPFASGTNLQEKYLDISVVTGGGTCVSPETAGYAPGVLTPTTLTINGLPWTKENSGQGAAGSIYEWTAYSTVSGSVCVSLTFILHATNPEMYPTPPATFNETSESNVFILIVDTFSWLHGGAVTPTLSGWLTYTNLAYGFQLQYPPGGGGLQPGDTAVFARIDLPFAAGTNLAEKYLEISVTDGASTCASPHAAGYAPGHLTPTTETIHGLTWVKENASEGAAGSIYAWTAYSTVSGSVCVSLSFILHSHPPDLWPTPPPSFDDAVESAVFLQIVQTFIWLDGAAVTPTSVTSSTPTPVSPAYTFTPTPVSPAYTFTPTPASPAYTFTPTPVSGASFTPHLNAYCRTGPDPIFESIAVALKGQTYPIDGRNQENTYYLLILTDQVECWVLQSTGEASGNLSNIRVMLPIPTPTLTPPPVNCSQYVDKKSCDAVLACTWTQLNDKVGVCTNK